MRVTWHSPSHSYPAYPIIVVGDSGHSLFIRGFMGPHRDILWVTWHSPSRGTVVELVVVVVVWWHFTKL
jgi:hypothetical protein